MVKTHDQAVAGCPDRAALRSKSEKEKGNWKHSSGLSCCNRPWPDFLLANRVSVGKVALTYHANSEQLLVPSSPSLPPEGTVHPRGEYEHQAGLQGANTSASPQPQSAVRRAPPGFPAAPPRRVPTFRGRSGRARPGRPVLPSPADSPFFNVRGPPAPNTPCVTCPGKARHPPLDVRKHEQYVALKPTATTGKATPTHVDRPKPIPHYPPGSPPAARPCFRRFRRPAGLAAAHMTRPHSNIHRYRDGGQYTQFGNLAPKMRRGDKTMQNGCWCHRGAGIGWSCIPPPTNYWTKTVMRVATESLLDSDVPASIRG